MSAEILYDSPEVTQATLCGKTLERQGKRWFHEDGQQVGDTFYLVLEKALREHRRKP